MILIRRLHFLKTVKETKKVIEVVSNFEIQSKYQYSDRNSLKRKQIFNNKSLSDGPKTSQYVSPPPNEIAQNKILEYISDNNPKSYDEWQSAKELFYVEIPLLSDVNYSSIVMNALLSKNMYNTAHSFMQYLHASNLKPNNLTYLQYVALCGRNVRLCDQKEVQEIFTKIQPSIESEPVLDLKRASYFIQGLCGTDKWRTSFEYLKKVPQDPNGEIKNSIATAAIRNGDENLAWDILFRWLKNDEGVAYFTLKEFLIYANNLRLKDKRRADIFLLKFFSYMEQNDVIINIRDVYLIEEYFKSHSSKWNISYTKIERNGKCSLCQNTLKSAGLSDEEFLFLRKSFLEKSVKKKDIFINTTEKEFKKYINFLDKHKPFQVVIDGLNVAYTVQDAKNGRNMAYHVLQIVKMLSSKYQKILVLGREQMIGWPKSLMHKISQRADLFLTSNISQDDPFTIYAALASGPNTHVLTKDLMRDHMSRLNTPKLIQLFKKWQQSHQILLVSEKQGEIEFIEPLKHSITVQGDMEEGFHIPVEDNILREPYEELNNWLCISRIRP